MIIHQTVGVAEPVTLFDNISQYIQKGFTILIISIYIIPCITSGGNVVYCSWILDT